MRSKARDYNIAVLESALKTLDHFLACDLDGSNLSEISKQLGITISRTFRILSTLESRDYVRQDPATRRYRLGVRLIELGERARKEFRLVEVAAPILTQLAEQTGETVFLGVLDGQEMICIDRRESIHSIRLNAEIGQRIPLHTGGVAKTLFAYQAPAFIEEYLRRPLARATDLTITHPQRMREALEEIRRRGVCVTRGDLEVGACSVAAPIRDHRGNVVAAISAAGPEDRFGPEDEPRLVNTVQKAAGEISRRLGYAATPQPPPSPDADAPSRMGEKLVRKSRSALSSNNGGFVSGEGIGR
jgi:IclR family transcriptional regulator, KDG regulon repressor